MVKKLQIAFVSLFFCTLTALSALIFLTPDRTFSENENTYLTTREDLAQSSIWDGSFQEKLSDYLSDQFPARDFWTAVGARVKKLTGRKEIGGVYLGEDHYFFEKFTDADVDSARLSAQMEIIEGFAREQTVPVRVIFVPTPGVILSQKLPKGAVLYDMDGVLETVTQSLPSCQIIDLRETFSNQTEQIYYRTDHHWTNFGAYLGYRAYCSAAGLESHPMEEFAVEQMSDSFLGTLYSKTLDSSAIPDSIYAPRNVPEVTVRTDSSQIPLYDLEKLGEKDKYAMFFGGNYGSVTIETSADTGRVLLVVKDSFANSMMPYLLREYDRIIMLDFRYFSGSVRQILDSQGITDVLFLYETSNFLSDANIHKLTR